MKIFVLATIWQHRRNSSKHWLWYGNEKLSINTNTPPPNTYGVVVVNFQLDFSCKISYFFPFFVYFFFVSFYLFRMYPILTPITYASLGLLCVCEFFCLFSTKFLLCWMILAVRVCGNRLAHRTSHKCAKNIKRKLCEQKEHARGALANKTKALCANNNINSQRKN